jgi:capsule polysaccharide export protein KpsE/RkpR
MTITADALGPRKPRIRITRQPALTNFVGRVHRMTGGPMLPYVFYGGGAILLVWLLAFAYLTFMPVSYASRWSFILPPSANGASVSVESIGQTSTVASSPFSAVTLSPKVIYREIVGSREVADAAAETMGMTSAAFGMPRIKLIDETSLMNFEIAGTTAKEAQAKAQALINAFNQRLDQLRADELAKRAAATEVQLKSYQTSVTIARDRINALQRESGLLSLNHFAEVSSGLEQLRRKVIEVKADLDKIESAQDVLTRRVGIGARDAALALKIAADPAFSKLLLDFAEVNAKYAEETSRLGPMNPYLIHTEHRRTGISSEILAMARHVGIDRKVNLQRLLLMVNGSHQAEMLRTIVANEAALIGRRDELQSLESEIPRLDGETKRLGSAATRLEDLKKDHIVAEAVLKSALARLDTNKTDIFQSYPIVQVLSQPELAVSRAQPRLIYAMLGGTAGTLLILMAMGLIWLQMTFGRRLSTSA